MAQRTEKRLYPNPKYQDEDEGVDVYENKVKKIKIESEDSSSVSLSSKLASPPSSSSNHHKTDRESDDHEPSKPQPATIPIDILNSKVEDFKIDHNGPHYNAKNFPEDKKYYKLIQNYIKEGDERVFYKRKFVMVNFSDYGLMNEFDRDSYYFPGEFYAAVFSIFDGIIDDTHSMIYPGQVPTGNAFEYKENATKKVLPLLENYKNQAQFDFYTKFYEPFDNLIKRYHIGDLRNPRKSVILFTKRDSISAVNSCLEFCLQRTEINGEIKTQFFDLCPLELLIQILEGRTKIKFGLGGYEPKNETEEIALLADFGWEHNPLFGCGYHYIKQNQMGVEHCAKSKVKRWILKFFQLIKNINIKLNLIPDEKTHNSEIHCQFMKDKLEEELKKIKEKAIQNQTQNENNH